MAVGLGTGHFSPGEAHSLPLAGRLGGLFHMVSFLFTHFACSDLLPFSLDQEARVAVCTGTFGHVFICVCSCMYVHHAILQFSVTIKCVPIFELSSN